MRFVLTEEEYGEVGEAAAQAGMAKGAYAAHATLAGTGADEPVDAPFRQALTELIRAAGLVRRIGVNLNQAVAKLNATGQRSGDLLLRGGVRAAGGTAGRSGRGRAEAASVIGKVLHGGRPARTDPVPVRARSA